MEFNIKIKNLKNRLPGMPSSRGPQCFMPFSNLIQVEITDLDPGSGSYREDDGGREPGNGLNIVWKGLWEGLRPYFKIRYSSPESVVTDHSSAVISIGTFLRSSENLN